jgi:hypothetical protein
MLSRQAATISHDDDLVEMKILGITLASLMLKTGLGTRNL